MAQGAVEHQNASVGTRDCNASEGNITIISEAGDLVVHFRHNFQEWMEDHAYRVSMDALRNASPYFDKLLHPDKFAEGAAVEARQRTLREAHGSAGNALTAELPSVDILDIGRISKVKSIRPLISDFLRIIHGQNPSSGPPPVANLANLAIVADRFGAIPLVSAFVKRKKYMPAIDARTPDKKDKSTPEEKTRQRLLVALLFGHSGWVNKCSLRLIFRGWVGHEPDPSAALWWDLPLRVEEELLYRRECVLETIQSLQSHFLALYTSRERQCKLGYDSSVQCDSFQLGETIRFFSRSGTLRLQGTLFDTAEPPEPFAGEIADLVEALRKCPEYQIDKNHTHCGLRTRLIPLLDLVEAFLQDAGICGDCWESNRADYAWLDAKRPLIWKRSSIGLRSVQTPSRGLAVHEAKHRNVREFFTAVERLWTASDG
ncbi:hypothetical protein LTR66_012270 [Elasticomyces elasticus]|nr:hypothetical protein LTR66_012270 [Elasticomyces elasticus]